MAELKDVREPDPSRAWGPVLQLVQNAFLGRMTTHEISQLRVDTLFMSMSAYQTTSSSISIWRWSIPSEQCSIRPRPGFCWQITPIRTSRAARIIAVDQFDIVIVDDGTPAVHIARMRDKASTSSLPLLGAHGHASAIQRYDPDAK